MRNDNLFKCMWGNVLPVLISRSSGTFFIVLLYYHLSLCFIRAISVIISIGMRTRRVSDTEKMESQSYRICVLQIPNIIVPMSAWYSNLCPRKCKNMIYVWPCRVYSYIARYCMIKFLQDDFPSLAHFKRLYNIPGAATIHSSTPQARRFLSG